MIMKSQPKNDDDDDDDDDDEMLAQEEMLYRQYNKRQRRRQQKQRGVGQQQVVSSSSLLCSKISFLALLLLSIVLQQDKATIFVEGTGCRFPVSELNNYLAIGTAQSTINTAINISNTDMGADIKILSSDLIKDNVNLELETIFLADSSSQQQQQQQQWMNSNPDYLPGAAGIHQGISWSGDVIVTTNRGQYSCTNSELYSQHGLTTYGGTKGGNLINCNYFKNGIGDGFDTTGDGVTFYTKGGYRKDTNAVTALQRELRSLYQYIYELEPDVTFTANGGNGGDGSSNGNQYSFPNATGIIGIKKYIMNVDEYDINHDFIAVIDIDCGDYIVFNIENTNWIIDSQNKQTFALFRILGSCDMIINSASIVIGDGSSYIRSSTNTQPPIFENNKLKAIFIKMKDYIGTGGSPNILQGEPMNSRDTTFSIKNSIINGIGFYDLIYWYQSLHMGRNDKGTTNMKIINTQGCGQFISPSITFHNTRLELCNFKGLGGCGTNCFNPSDIISTGGGVGGNTGTERVWTYQESSSSSSSSSSSTSSTITSSSTTSSTTSAIQQLYNSFTTGGGSSSRSTGRGKESDMKKTASGGSSSSSGGNFGSSSYQAGGTKQGFEASSSSSSISSSLSTTTTTGGGEISNGPMTNCKTQSECIMFDIEEKENTICSNQYGCQFEVCLTLNFVADYCPKPVDDTISHICKKNKFKCMNHGTLGFDYGKATEVSSGLSHGYKHCQTAPPNTKLNFLLKDGAGCDANGGGIAAVEVSGSSIASMATCAPREDTSTTGSCTGNGPLKECIWSIITPPKCQIYSTGGIQYTDQYGCSISMEIKDLGNGEQNVVTVRTCPEPCPCDE